MHLALIDPKPVGSPFVQSGSGNGRRELLDDNVWRMNEVWGIGRVGLLDGCGCKRD
jgi:hypothetical protein